MVQSQLQLPSKFVIFVALLLVVVLQPFQVTAFPRNRKEEENLSSLEEPGEYSVVSEKIVIPTGTTATDKTISAEIFTPSTKEIPYAFVLFMPGFGTSYSSYNKYLEHLASYGYLAVGMDFTGGGFTIDGEHDKKAKEALIAIDYVQKLDNARYSSIPVYTAGHSMGGKIAFYAAAASSTISIDGMLTLDPVNAGGPPCFISPNQCTNYPVAPNPATGQRGELYKIKNGTASLIFRSEPTWTNPDEQFNAMHFFYGSDGNGLDAVPGPALYYNLGNFGHASYVPLIPSTQIQIIKRTMVAFLQEQVQGIDRKEYLTGSIIQTDIEEGNVVNLDFRGVFLNHGLVS